MELLIITAVQEFEKDIKYLLKKSGVSAFSYTNVTGYKDQSDQPMESNWFASNIGEYASVLFYAFVKDSLIDEVTSAIDALNASQESLSRVHVAVLDIKKSTKTIKS
jgi:nitrogen regulatory protein PII